MLFISARSGHQEIWIKNLRNGEDSMLTATRAIKLFARFSPDGSKVAFTVGPNWDAYIVPTAGGAPELVFEGCGWFSGWSSNGKLAICNNLEYRLNLVDLESRRKTELLARTDRLVLA
jgi:Tol biopolymer transport system component